MHIFSSLFRTAFRTSIKYKVENLSGKILCRVKKPKYAAIRMQLIKANYIDGNTGFKIIKKLDDNTIMIVFQDFKAIFEVDNIFSMKELNVSDLNIISNLELLSQLTNLTELYLGGNPLTHIPSEIGNLINLTNLDLCYNQLIDIPSEIGKLTNLISLNLTDNKITHIQSEIWNLTSLTKLCLDYNQLTEIPSEIGKLTNLIYLNLGNNQLKNEVKIRIKSWFKQGIVSL